MRFVDEFRDPEIIAKTAEEVRRLADTGKHYRLWKCAAAIPMLSIALG